MDGNGATTVIADSPVTGNLQGRNNTAATEGVGNTVGGNLQVQDNTGPSTQVGGSGVGGNLQCESNAAITGGGNSARRKQGRCASL